MLQTFRLGQTYVSKSNSEAGRKAEKHVLKVLDAFLVAIEIMQKCEMYW